MPKWKQDYNAGHRKVRARIEHALARLKTYKILRDYRRAGRTLATTASGIAHLDVRMSVMDSLEATRRILSRKDSRSTPPLVLMLTTFDIDDY